MADVATVSTVADAAGGGGVDTTSSQCSGNRQEMKIEREDSNNQISSDSRLAVPVSHEGEKGRKEKPPSSTGHDGKTGGSRKRKEMEGGRMSRREARPKRQKVTQQYVLIGLFDTNFCSSPAVGYGTGCCETEQTNITRKGAFVFTITIYNIKLTIVHVSIIIFCTLYTATGT